MTYLLPQFPVLWTQQEPVPAEGKGLDNEETQLGWSCPWFILISSAFNPPKSSTALGQPSPLSSKYSCPVPDLFINVLLGLSFSASKRQAQTKLFKGKRREKFWNFNIRKAKKKLTDVRRNFLLEHKIEAPLNRRIKNSWCLCEKSRATENENHTNGTWPSSLVVERAQPLGHYGEQELQHWQAKQVITEDLSNEF